MVETIYQANFAEGGFNILWQCPYCDHSLECRIKDDDVGKLAMVSHLARRHMMSFWQILNIDPDARKAAEEYFGDDVW